jgi:hypothetical protein
MMCKLPLRGYGHCGPISEIDVWGTPLVEASEARWILVAAARANSLAFFDGGYEPDAVRFLTRCYDRDGAFLDIGDNIGLISLPFADISL